MFYYDYYSLVLLFPVMIFSLIIQFVLNNTYSKYSKISNSRRATGADIARMILMRAGVNDVSIELTAGKLSDHFDPTKNVIRLSQAVYNGTSISAIGVAAHETGHALQYAFGYSPMKLRSSVVGITNFSSKILYFVILLSVFSGFSFLCDIAVICFLVIFLFQVITLPVEFNASKRAIACIKEMGYSTSDVGGVKKVLFAAAMTYVAAMLTAFAQLLSFFLRTRDRRDNG